MTAFKLDHLMVEVEAPEAAAGDFARHMGLPFAWPLIEAEDYTSQGVNLGDLNIEFIQFRRRFGVKDQPYSGFSGVAFSTELDITECQHYFAQQGVSSRIGETSESHTTLVIEEARIFPTIFIVQYRFDTSGWKRRLASDFQDVNGGTYRLKHCHGVELDCRNENGVLDLLGITSAQNHRVTFSHASSEQPQALNIVRHLEIVMDSIQA